MFRMGTTMRSAKMKEITPPKLIPPFHRTAASGTFPIEQTNDTTATTGPITGPQNFATVGWEMRKKSCQNRSGTHAASAPAISSPPTMSFAMDWHAIWKDIVGGLLIAGALAAWVPERFWHDFFLISHPTVAKFWGPVIGPAVAVVSFVCSIGNVPLAAVLWNGGISFGGVISFIFADLIVVPILNIYRKYYGGKVSLFLLGTFYATMVVAGLIIEFLFDALGLIPSGPRHAKVVEAHVSLNYTSALNFVFVAQAAVLVVRFLRTGGPEMLRMMKGPTDHGAGHGEMAY